MKSAYVLSWWYSKISPSLMTIQKWFMIDPSCRQRALLSSDRTHTFLPKKITYIRKHCIILPGRATKRGGSNTRIIIINNNNLLLIPPIPYNMPLLLKEYAERIYFNFLGLLPLTIFSSIRISLVPWHPKIIISISHMLMKQTSWEIKSS